MRPATAHLVAIRALFIYKESVSIFKTLALICSLLSLFVQGSAYAAAIPQGEMTQVMDCAEMASHDAGQMDARKAQDTGNPCKNMTLGCLVAMGCIAPLSLSGVSAINLPPVHVSIFSAALADKLHGMLTRPESPPPQMMLSA
ncbi:hypothetical protein [Parasphingorhabdus sp.]|uniref:hypothetical protein n=1 Tax=Parasphingorhabdus sp. TaxID=2709688 RepID=UPI002F95BE34